MSFLKAFFSHVIGTKKGILVPEELYRSIMTSLGSGGLVGLALMILQSVLSHVAGIFPNAGVAGFATLSITLIMDLLRRLNQGDKQGQVVVVNPGPASVATPAV